jgi:hypothetical protein
MESESKSTIGDLSEDELKNIVRTVINEEALQSRIPLLGAQREKKLKRWLIIGVAALVVGWLGYRTFFYDSGYSVLMDKSDMYIVKTVGWRTEKRQIKVVDNRWQLRYDFDDKQLWAPVFTPFEVKYNDNYKFIFVGRGNLFWVSNDRISARPVKLIDGEWKFQSDLTDEWLDFDF